MTVAELDAAPEQFQAECSSVSLEKWQVRTCAASGIEQFRIRSSGRGLFNERGDKSLEAAKPEVPLFGLERAFE